jgi:hypothetical protein
MRGPAFLLPPSHSHKADYGNSPWDRCRCSRKSHYGTRFSVVFKTSQALAPTRAHYAVQRPAESRFVPGTSAGNTWPQTLAFGVDRAHRFDGRLWRGGLGLSGDNGSVFCWRRREPLTDVGNGLGESAGVDAKLGRAVVQAGKEPAAIAVGGCQPDAGEHRAPVERVTAVGVARRCRPRSP